MNRVNPAQKAKAAANAVAVVVASAQTAPHAATCQPTRRLPTVPFTLMTKTQPKTWVSNALSVHRVKTAKVVADVSAVAVAVVSVVKAAQTVHPATSSA